MKQPDIRTLVHDALTAASRIRDFVGDLDVDAYRSNEMVKSAVERQFEIIGEALSKAAKVDPTIGDRIAALPRVVAFRNQLIHGYFAIDPAVVWAVAHDHLPNLLSDLESELQRLEALYPDP